VRVSRDVEEPGSANRDDRPRPEDDDRSMTSLLRQVDEGDRRGIEFCLVVLLPMVVFWLLILLAPPGPQLDIGERIRVGMLVTALWVPIWSLRNFWGTRYGQSASRPRQGARDRYQNRHVGSVSITFSADQAAAALWRYGEDELVDRASKLTDVELRKIWTLAGSHWRQDHGLPIKSRLVPDKVIALGRIEYLEGGLRPLHQERRRPAASMPVRLQNAQPVRPTQPPSY
jgi:hypothetical protein